MEEQKKRKRGRPKGSKSSYTVSEKALAQRRAVSPVRPLAKTPEEVEYNARLIDFVLKTQEIASHANIKDVVSLRSALMNYLALCQQSGFKVSNLSACAAMGVSSDAVRQWLHSDRQEYKELAEFVHYICALSREQLIADNKLNPVIGIFWQRNFDGLRNDTEQQQAVTEDSTEDLQTAQDYVKKYGHLLPR